MLQIVFMGTSSFGVPCLDYLSSREDIHIAAVVTKPPRQKGRGRLLKDTPIKEKALERRLKVIEAMNIKEKDFARELRDLNPDLNIVVAFGKILPEEILSIPLQGSINIHPSLLPLYRGQSPINWAIINGDKETGVTSFFMEGGMDSGPIISQRKISISSKDDYGRLQDKLKGLAIEALEETLNKIKCGPVISNPQDNTKATLAPKITSDLAKIDWSCDAERIYNIIRGLSPEPGAYSFYKKGRFINEPENGAILIKIWKAIFLKEDSKGEIGKVKELTPSGLKVFSGEGIIVIQELQPAGKKKMTGRAFWSGYG